MVQFTDIFLFSHGWNNDWTVATRRYEDFIDGFIKMRQSRGLPMPSPYRPVLVGIFWPSAILGWDEEEAPQIAAGDPRALQDRAAAQDRDLLREVARALPPKQVERFYELAQKPEMTEPEALELAKILRPLYASAGDEVGSGAAPSAKEIVKATRSDSAPLELNRWNFPGAFVYI